jgi:hypothetical protein
VKAKRSATARIVRGQERKKAANVNIAVEVERERATIATEADKSKLSGFARRFQSVQFQINWVVNSLEVSAAQQFPAVAAIEVT